MALRFYGPASLRTVVQWQYDLIWPHLDRVEDIRVVLGPVGIKDGEVQVNREAMKRIDEIVDRQKDFFEGRVPLNERSARKAKEKLKKETSELDRRYKVASGAAFYLIDFDLIVLTFRPIFYSLISQKFSYRLDEEQRAMVEGASYYFPHECVHWDLSQGNPNAALRSISNRLTSTKNIGMDDLYKANISASGDDLVDPALLESMAPGPQRDYLMARVRMRPTDNELVQEGIAYAVEDHLAKKSRHDERLHGLDPQGFNRVYDWTTASIATRGIKETLRHAKQVFNSTYEQDTSPLALLLEQPL